MSCKSRVIESSRRIVHAHALNNWFVHAQQICLFSIFPFWDSKWQQSGRLHCAVAWRGLMVAQKYQASAENIQIKHGCRFQEKERVTGHMVALNWLSVATWCSYWPLVIPESPSVLFLCNQSFIPSRLSPISYACKNIDTKLSTGVAGVRFLLMWSATIPFCRDLSVYAKWRFYCLLFKFSSCNTSLLFTRSPCTARLCKLTVRLYCFPVPWKAQQALGLWPNYMDSCQYT